MTTSRASSGSLLQKDGNASGTERCGFSQGVAYSFSVSQQTRHYAEYEWSLRRLLEGEAVRLKSPEFKVGGTSWRIDVYPFGRRIEDRHFLSAFLTHVAGPSPQVMLCFTAKSVDDDRILLGSVCDYKSNQKSCGFYKFLHHDFMLSQGFYTNSLLRLNISVQVIDPMREMMNRFRKNLFSSNEVSLGTKTTTSVAPISKQAPECVVCLVNPVTSGFLHNGESHQCVCEGCAKKLAKIKDLKCPVCMAKVDNVIYKFF